MKCKIARHHVHPNREVVEIYTNEGKLVATVYPIPETEPGPLEIRLVSRLLSSVKVDQGQLIPIPAVVSLFHRPE